MSSSGNNLSTWFLIGFDEGSFDRNGLLGAISKKQLQNSCSAGCKLGSIQ